MSKHQRRWSQVALSGSAILHHRYTHTVPGKPTISGEIDAPNHNAAIVHAIDLITAPETGVMTDLSDLVGIGFKTILARGIWRSALITDEVIDALEADIPFAPTHNPAYIASIRAFRERLPNTPLVAVFETWFHQTMPDYASEFGVPREWVEKHHIRRYGFHGASHRYISERVPQLARRSTTGESANYLLSSRWEFIAVRYPRRSVD